MRKRMKLRRFSHTTFVAYLSLFLVVSGGAAYAAGHLGKNTVGPKQLKKSSVTTAKIKNNAVTGAKVKDGSLTGSDLADGAITGAKVADGSLSGADINQSSLSSVRASNVIGVSMNANCTPAAPFPSGVSAEAVGSGCKVTFGSSVINCAVTASAALRINSGILIIAGERTAFTIRHVDAPNVVITSPYFNGSLTPLPVDLTVVC